MIIPCVLQKWLIVDATRDDLLDHVESQDMITLPMASIGETTLFLARFFGNLFRNRYISLNEHVYKYTATCHGAFTEHFISTHYSKSCQVKRPCVVRCKGRATLAFPSIISRYSLVLPPTCSSLPADKVCYRVPPEVARCSEDYQRHVLSTCLK